MADSECDSEGEGYGPPPPTTTPKLKDDKEEKDEDDSYIPALPPHLRKAGEGVTTAAHESQDSPSARQETDSSESEDEGEEYCPALPPHMVQGGAKRSTPEPPQRRDLVGPMLPKGFVPPPEAIKESDAKKVEEEDEEEEEEDSVLGPVPSIDNVTPEEYRAQEFEERARRMREKLEGRDKGSSKPMARESWMTELPEDKAHFCGLGARQFLRKTPKEKGDRSCWTDTPSDKAKKEKEQKESPKEELNAVEEAVTQRDKELAEKVEEYNKTKRAKPLVDLHRTELKRKQGNDGPKERRAFSREEDMNVNKFDDAQKETIMKKARQLNDRFSSGKAKFL